MAHPLNPNAYLADFLAHHSAWRPLSQSESMGFAGAGGNALCRELGDFLVIIDTDDDGFFRLGAHGEAGSWEARPGREAGWGTFV